MQALPFIPPPESLSDSFCPQESKGTVYTMGQRARQKQGGGSPLGHTLTSVASYFSFGVLQGVGFCLGPKLGLGTVGYSHSSHGKKARSGAT